MELQEYLINDLEPLDVSEPVQRAQDMFSQFTISHIPILNGTNFLGTLSETDAHCFTRSESLEDINYVFEMFFVRPEDHWLELLEAFVRHETNLMPVLSNKGEYLGYYELRDIIRFFNESPFLSEPGSVVVVEKGTQEMSFSEIAQIVESNDSSLFGFFISAHRENITQVTIKLGGSNRNEVLQTFRRYGYTVVSTSHDDTYLDTLKERSDYLSKYLEF